MNGPLYFGCKEHAEDVASDCPSRPSSYPSLAKKGIEEFKVEFSEEHWKNIQSDSTKVCAKADISAEDYATVKRAMEGEVPLVKKARRPTSAPKAKAIEDMLPEERAAYEAAARKKASVVAMQSAQQAANRCCNIERRAAARPWLPEGLERVLHRVV